MRHLLALAAGTLVTLSLFYFMSTLISQKKELPDVKDSGNLIDFIRVKPDDNLQTRQRTVPKKPPPPEQPPMTPKMQVADNQRPQSEDLNIQAPNIADGLKGGAGPYLGGGGGPTGDAEEMPIVRIEPQYPQKAAMQGLEGAVTVSFTITKTGSVRDVKIVESNPPRVFDRSVQRAVMRWRYKPRYVNGEAVERRSYTTLEFKLSD